MSVAVARMGVVLHPEGGALHTHAAAVPLGAGGRVGSGKQYVSWIHREDAVAALRFLVEHPELEGPVNAHLAGAAHQHRASPTRWATVLGRPSMMHIPAFVLKAALGEMAQMALEGQRVLPRRAHRGGLHLPLPPAERGARGSAPGLRPASRGARRVGLGGLQGLAAGLLEGMARGVPVSSAGSSATTMS